MYGLTVASGAARTFDSQGVGLFVSGKRRICEQVSVEVIGLPKKVADHANTNGCEQCSIHRKTCAAWRYCGKQYSY